MSKISLKHSGGNVVSLNSPTSAPTSADVAFKLPNADGTSGQAIVTDASGNLSFAGTGKILQVVQAVKTDTSSSTSESYADISGLSVSITPASSSNKILVTCNIHVSGHTDSFQAFKVLRDSTAIGLGTAGTGNQTNASFATMVVNQGSGQYGLRTGNFEFLDSPSSTSALTYKVQWASTYQDYASYINRPHSTVNDDYSIFPSSTITVKEVAP
tara:strand:+ start:942 stop:1583 length:642 start_codon:yes stop_codon:yes gene_type:complete